MDNTKTNAVEATAKITYQFTAVPTNLFILLDNNCRSMLFTLIQLSSFYSNEDGYFFRTNSDLSEESNLSQKLVIATVDTLYSKGLIAVNTVGKSKGKQANYYKVNFDVFAEYEKYSKEELKNPVLKIETIDYKAKGYSPSYLSKVSQSTEQSYHQDFPKVSPTFPKVPTNIDSIYIINNKEDIYNKDITNIYNIANEKELHIAVSVEADASTSTSTEENKTVDANAVPLNKEIYSKLVKEIENGCSTVRLNGLISQYFNKLSDLDRKEIKEYYTNYNMRKAS